MEQTRKEFIESEYKKWEERYEINFEQEFDLKAMIELQYQFEITPKEHIKTIGDIVHTKNQIMKNLNLKKKPFKKKDGSKYKILLLSDNIDSRDHLSDLFKLLLNKDVITFKQSLNSTELLTNDFQLSIVNPLSDLSRGKSGDLVVDLSSMATLTKSDTPYAGRTKE